MDPIEDGLRKEDWLTKTHDKVLNLINSTCTNEELADQIMSIIIEERADMLLECERDFGRLSMPDFEECEE